MTQISYGSTQLPFKLQSLKKWLFSNSKDLLWESSKMDLISTYQLEIKLQPYYLITAVTSWS